MKKQYEWKHLLAGLILLLTVVPLVCACSTEKPGEQVSVQDLQKKIAKDKGSVVLDVRTAPELTSELGKLDGVINIPVQELEQRLAELKAYQKSPVYVICRSGNRSGVATRILREHGFEAYNVTGGMRAWRAAFGANNR
ncbi:MAG: rhodanese-like domain-containing protein [Bacteroidetes bacterium]|nr:rhodanese-like domain-containing protein [Bacteroidota bacterium]